MVLWGTTSASFLTPSSLPEGHSSHGGNSSSREAARCQTLHMGLPIPPLKPPIWEAIIRPLLQGRKLRLGEVKWLTQSLWLVKGRFRAQVQGTVSKAQAHHHPNTPSQPLGRLPDSFQVLKINHLLLEAFPDFLGWKRCFCFAQTEELAFLVVNSHEDISSSFRCPPRLCNPCTHHVQHVVPAGIPKD